MTFKNKLAISVILSTVFLGTAWADAQDQDLYFSVLAGQLDDNQNTPYNSDTGMQLGFGHVYNENWNFEGYINKFDPDGLAAQTQKTFGVDFQRVFRRPSRFSPYVFLGAGIYDVVLESGLEDNGAGSLSGGIGFYADIFGESKTALRAEYRRRGDKAFSSNGRDDIFSLGLQFPFGGKDSGSQDDDGDGVTNLADECPNTPRGTSVNAYGCPEAADADADGVRDSVDQCPNTPTGVAVNAVGCPRDQDGDGVADYMDKCPNTVDGASVNEMGCELDSDSDGVADRIDRCPNTVADVIVDVYGCEIQDEIRLPGVNFETNSARLLPEATTVLQDAAQTLLNNKSVTIEVAGHTDSGGDANYNQDLSERRAQSVKDFLVARGVDPARMTVRGYGESQPIADNSTQAGKSENRRVVLRVLSK